MFALHTSNRAENLLSHLARVIESQPLNSPFDKELFLIQSQGMERWLSQQLSKHFGVWGNYQFYFPGNFFTEIGEQFSGSTVTSHYQREQMVWIFEHILREIESDSSGHFQILIDYIDGENSSVRRFQLAQQLARIFDQYQIMRPDWLRSWSKGELLGLGRAEQWQSLLWQRIEKSYGRCHRGEIWEQAIAEVERLSAGELSTKLPQRLSIFGLNTIPPLLLNLLRGLSRHIDIHLYLLTPTREYWGEGGSRRSIIEQLTTLDDSAMANDHRLLLSLGEQARDFRGLLLNQIDFSHEFASYEMNEEDTPSTLGRLQNDLLSNSSYVQEVRHADFAGAKTGGAGIVERDNSIAIHSCHSRLREVEVMHDQILDLLNRDSDLQLRDIVVMSPDIQNYSPHIKVIFGDIPHAIADRTLKEDSEILDNMIQFLRLSRGRFGWQEVIDLLEKPAIFSAFGLAESELEMIRHWISEVNIRWGLSGEHRTEFELPGFEAFSWQAGLDRLIMGYIMGENDNPMELTDGILPYSDIEGSNAQSLGALFRFITILSQAHSELSQPVSLAEWAERISIYSKQIFDPQSADERGVTHLNTLVEQLSVELGAIHHGAVDIEVIEQWMENYLSESKSSNGFLRGEVTFCSMLPMRAIPFKVIALLGMNEGEYPRVVQPYTFDLMAGDHRQGDRSARNDDRAQFLDTLLSARERLLITYVGQSIQDNSEIPPSAVVSELIDILEINYRQRDIVTKHPLQPFNSNYYSDRDVSKNQEQGSGSAEEVSALFSYSESNAKTARLLMGVKRGSEISTPWWQGSIDKNIEEVIELSSLFKFFKNPQAAFLREALGISLYEAEGEPAERECFERSALDNYITNQHIVEQLIEDPDSSGDSLIMEDGWWIGAAGEMELEKRLESIVPFVEEIRSLNCGSKIDKVDVDIKVGRYRIVGQLNDNYESGALLYRYSRFKGGDLIRGWLYHQIVNRIVPVTTTVITQDRQLQMQPGAINQGDLERWLDIYHAGQLEPSALFVEPALSYLKQLSIKSKKSPTDAARTALIKQFTDGYNPELELLYRNVTDIGALISEPFETICTELLLPLWSELL